LNDSKLELFFKTLTQGGSSDNSHIIKVPTGLGISLSDYLRQTPILSLTGVQDGGTGGGEFNEFGFNPATDPELYEAMQLSRQLYEEQNKPQETQDTQELPPLEPDGDVNMYEDDDVQAAIQLSLQTGALNDQQESNNPPPSSIDTNTSNQIASPQPVNTQKEENLNEQIEMSNINSDFLKEVLEGLEGVEMDNPDIQHLISNFDTEKKDDKKPEEKKDQ